MKTPIIIIDSEGAIEASVKTIYNAMKDKEKKPIEFEFMCPTGFMHTQFVNHLNEYLVTWKKAKKVSHVKINIYLETTEEDSA
jgi:predicted RNA-binding protein with RPS1 domain